jgi:hypothetical protein
LASPGQLSSDQDLRPNGLVDPDTGQIDYSAGSWSAGSWSTAPDPLKASWAAGSWSCLDCSASASPGVAPTAGSWSNLGWATTLG